MRIPFLNRTEAGRELAAELGRYRGRSNLLVLGLPRGGVPVAFEVATALDASLDVLLVRKLGAPGHKELAMGAVAAGGIRILRRGLIRELGISAEAIEQITSEELVTLDRRERLYRGGKPALGFRHRVVILVDDGIATGATMRAAILAARQKRVDRVIVAAPVASVRARESLERAANEVVCLATPDPFYAVAAWYEDFPQVSDEEVRRLLAPAPEPQRPTAALRR